MRFRHMVTTKRTNRKPHAGTLKVELEPTSQRIYGPWPLAVAKTAIDNLYHRQRSRAALL